MRSHLFIFLYLHYSDSCSDWENFEDYPGDFHRCACLQSAACGGTLFAARTRYLCSVYDFGLVITLYSCGSDFCIHNAVACV
jgi:hypothetical protein